MRSYLQYSILCNLISLKKVKLHMIKIGICDQIFSLFYNCLILCKAV